MLLFAVCYMSIVFIVIIHHVLHGECFQCYHLLCWTWQVFSAITIVVCYMASVFSVTLFCVVDGRWF